MGCQGERSIRDRWELQLVTGEKVGYFGWNAKTNPTMGRTCCKKGVVLVRKVGMISV